jgi:hypothetical protein
MAMVFFTIKYCQKEIFNIQQRIDFGGFQSLEVRGGKTRKNLHIHILTMFFSFQICEVGGFAIIHKRT